MQNSLQVNTNLLVFTVLVIAGIVFCVVGAVLLPVLLVPGGICLTGAAAVGRHIVKNRAQRPEPEPANANDSHLAQDLHQVIEELERGRAHTHDGVIINIERPVIRYSPHYDFIARPERPSLEHPRNIQRVRSNPVTKEELSLI